MKKYVSPKMKITVFADNDFVCTASSDPTQSTKEKVTGDGPGIVLPDDEW